MFALVRFFAYYRQFFREFARDWTNLVREQVLVGLALAALTVWFQVRQGIIARADLAKNLETVLYPYGIILALFVAWHLVRTPWKMHQRLTDEVQSLRPPPSTVRPFRDLIQFYASENGRDISLSLVNAAASDWFTVSVIDVQPRVTGDGAQASGLVRWSDTREQQRHIPKNSTATLALCRVEAHEGDRDRKSIMVRFFTPSDDRTIYLSLAGAWTAQKIFIGFRQVIPEIDVRIAAAGVTETTDRRISLVLNDSLEPRVYRVDVLRRGQESGG